MFQRYLLSSQTIPAWKSVRRNNPTVNLDLLQSRVITLQGRTHLEHKKSRRNKGQESLWKLHPSHYKIQIQPLAQTASRSSGVKCKSVSVKWVCSKESSRRLSSVKSVRFGLSVPLQLFNPKLGVLFVDGISPILSFCCYILPFYSAVSVYPSISDQARSARSI